MKTAHYEETTQKLLGWYDKDIHTSIPTPNIEVTNEVWQTAIDSNANYVDIVTKTLSVKDLRTEAEILQAIEDAKPKSVSRVQAMKAMKQTGTLWVDFNDLLATNQDAKDEWDLANELQRNNTLTLSLSATLNLTETELDDLFLLASTL